MGKKLKNYISTIMLVFLLSLVADSLLIESDLCYQDASAPTREFEENITIPSNELQVLNLVFSEGDELELIFTLQVEQELPIDVWFVDYPNYVRVVDGNEFIYFIDGSDQEITQASKIVSVTMHGTYVLVLANYNNETVVVHLTYDINTYPEEPEKGESIPFWKEYYVMLPLGIVIGIIAGLLISRVLKKSRKEEPEKDSKTPKKKKKRKPKKVEPKAATPPPKKKVKVRKAKKKVVEDTEEAPTEEVEDLEAEEEEPEDAEETPKEEVGEPKAVEKAPSPNFCGHCGKPVETPFCPHCGKEVGKA